MFWQMRKNSDSDTGQPFGDRRNLRAHEYLPKPPSAASNDAAVRTKQEGFASVDARAKPSACWCTVGSANGG
jgi:hypothetical protein